MRGGFVPWSKDSNGQEQIALDAAVPGLRLVNKRYPLPIELVLVIAIVHTVKVSLKCTNAIIECNVSIHDIHADHTSFEVIAAHIGKLKVEQVIKDGTADIHGGEMKFSTEGKNASMLTKDACKRMLQTCCSYV
jgi:hypothetical protein